MIGGATADENQKRMLSACRVGYDARVVMKTLRFLLAAAALLTVCGCARIRPPRGTVPVARRLLATGYCRCGRCCGWRRTWYGRPVVASGRNKGRRKRVGMTASGTMARPGTIAADTSLYPFGTVPRRECQGAAHRSVLPQSQRSPEMGPPIRKREDLAGKPVAVEPTPPACPADERRAADRGSRAGERLAAVRSYP